MRILIVEPHASGHHASYVRWLVQAAARKQWSVVLATTEAALAHPSLAGITVDFRDVHVHMMSGLPNGGPAVRPFALLRRELAYWTAIRRAATEVRRTGSIDAALLPYADYCFHALALLGSPFRGLPWCGISMRLRVEEGRSGIPFKWRIAGRVLRTSTLRVLFDINPSVRRVPTTWCSRARRSKLRYLPDPAEVVGGRTRPQSRAALGISDGQAAILVFGSIDERKGIDALLAGISGQEGMENYVVILAGKHSAAIQAQLRAGPAAELQARRHLIVLDRVLTDAERDQVFSAADVVWVGYRNHVYMSGVLVLAGRAGLPVVGTCDGEIGLLIAEYHFGIAARIDRQAEVTSALRAMLDAPARTGMGQRAQSAFADHTVENFGAGVLEALERPETW